MGNYNSSTRIISWILNVDIILTIVLSILEKLFKLYNLPNKSFKEEYKI